MAPENWTHSIALKMNFSGESFGDITCMNNVPNETLERIKVEPIKKGIFHVKHTTWWSDIDDLI